MTKRRFLIPVLFFLLGCKVGPKYIAPTPVIPEEWTAPVVVNQDEPEIEWWKNFDDPLLEKYVALASCYNKDLAMASANIMKARAGIKIANAARFPEIDLNTNYKRNHFSSNIFFQPPTQDTPQIFPIFQINQEYYNIGFDAAWEMDIWGKIESNMDAADARFWSAVEARNDLMISIFGDVGRNYMTIRGNQKLIELQEKDIELLTTKLNLVKSRNQRGVVNNVEILTMEQDLSARKAVLPDLYTNLYQAIYQLSVLVGLLPECILDEVMVFAPIPSIPEKVTVGFRSDLLRRRPDVRSAERDLAAATADLRVAVAELFPTMRIGGNISQQSLHFGNLFNGSSNAWATEVDVLTPVFHGGKLMGNVDWVDAERARVFFAYERAVITAVADTENALTRFAKKYESSGFLESSFSSNTKALSLTKQLYSQGVINNINYIDNERNSIALNSQLIQNQMDTLIALISLYKSLGGCFE